MTCPRCGTALTKRPRARMIVTGSILLVAAFLLLFVHVGVVVLAAALVTRPTTT